MQIYYLYFRKACLGLPTFGERRKTVSGEPTEARKWRLVLPIFGERSTHIFSQPRDLVLKSYNFVSNIIKLLLRLQKNTFFQWNIFSVGFTKANRDKNALENKKKFISYKKIWIDKKFEWCYILIDFSCLFWKNLIIFK